MATGVYGTVRPADFKPSDAEIFVHYTPNRGDNTNVSFTKYSGDELLVNTTYPGTNTLFGGLYTLKLPVGIFSTKGFYTIIIKPLEIRTKINDCGVLSNLPDVRGLIFDIAGVPTEHQSKFTNNGLIGYRIEYFSPDIPTEKVSNLFRIITSNNTVEEVTNVQSNNVQIRNYLFNNTNTLSFCSVSPSSAPSSKPDVIPFIGQVGQNVIITNTFFNPVMLEIEMVDHDIETLAYALMGNQTKSLEDGIYTIYNFQGGIYKQYNLFEIKEQFNGTPLFEVREEKTDGFDFTKNLNTITNGL